MIQQAKRAEDYVTTFADVLFGPILVFGSVLLHFFFRLVSYYVFIYIRYIICEIFAYGIIERGRVRAERLVT